MAKRTLRSARETEYREAFLAELNGRLATPTADRPTTRWWTELSLKALFREVRAALAETGFTSDLTHRALLEWLQRTKLASTLNAEGETFHSIEMGAAEGTTADPLELLMTGTPRGVVCYFTALAFHGLTTQPVSHHHVAELEEAVAAKEGGEMSEGGTPIPLAERPKAEGHRPRLGRLLFRLDGTPYYRTARSARLVPGIQTRAYGPRSLVRIATREQALLDALYKPFHCGGPEVAFEAWREGVRSGRLDEDRLAGYLTGMGYPATARRTAVMLALVGHAPGAVLRKALDAARDALSPAGPHARISLLPGVGYSTLNAEWLVLTP